MRVLVMIPLFVALAACGSHSGSSPGSGQNSGSSVPTEPINLPIDTPAQVAQRIDEVVSCFENSTKTIQYDYIEALGDGRGYTAGKAGFTTGTGDLVEVVKRYLTKVRDQDFEAILPTLQNLADTESGSINGLQALPTLWMSRSQTQSFRDAQDAETDELYTQPSLAYIAKYKLKTNLAKLIFYDTIIQHGDGDDADSFSGILKKMASKPSDEKTFLMNFLEARRKVLMNPADSSTTVEWRESVDRVNALERLISQNIWTLAPPFNLTVFGDTFSF